MWKISLFLEEYDDKSKDRLNTEFSFIVLTYNEEMHLPRLLRSISGLDAPVFVLDSGSTDQTVAIAEKAGAEVLQHAFENHPKQWDFALNVFNIQSPWVICLDADQVVTPQLLEKLQKFRDIDHSDVNGIYFNRRNFFKGRWIKHGGYSPFYLLKMIRYGTGYSDLNENMDHRLIVSGKTLVWKDGVILEENLKENEISFWIDKHNRYSTLLAHEEVERLQKIRSQTLNPRFWGSPDERTARLKQIWWRLPRYVRPSIYFFYRMVIQLGILDGQTGIIFHFLQAFWFRLIVDIKISELLSPPKTALKIGSQNENNTLKFMLFFVILFAFFYYFNIVFFAATTPSGHHYYNAYLATYLNYISWLRRLLLSISAGVLNLLGFGAISDEYHLLVAGHARLELVYSCLGLGVISFFSAFVLSYPKAWKAKMIFLIAGIIGVELLNVIRFVLLGIFGAKRDGQLLDHHTIFNIFLYLAICVSLYFWVKNDNKKNNVPS